MIAKINASGIIKLSSAVIKQAGYIAATIVDRHANYSNFRIDITGVNAAQEPSYPSWGLGSGYQVNVTGTRIFDEVSFGSSLEQLTVINRGPSNLYVSVNATGFVRDGNSVNLETDESLKMVGPISSIWAAAATGIAIVDGFGLPLINGNTI